MKKLYLSLIVIILIAALGCIVLEFSGYHKIQVDGGTLYGKLIRNDTDLVVLQVAGSGPTDMDGNNPLAQGINNSLLYLAKVLSKEGITTFRYDKRTSGKSSDTFDLEEPNFDLLVNDCVAVIKYLRQLGYKQIIVTGHSQGSLVGMIAATREPVEGFISLSGTGYPIDITYEKQLAAQFGEDSREVKVIQSLRNGNVDYSQEDNLPVNVSTQKFLLTYMKYDPAQILGQLHIPILVLHGASDLQVDMDDFNALKNANKEASSIVIPQMNHVLRNVVDDKENIKTYSDPSYTLHQDLVPVLKEFIYSINSK